MYFYQSSSMVHNISFLYFQITENDDLPHKICFRCSAKLEELYEFIQKCIKTQENLRSAIGRTGPFLTKSKMGKKLWEEKLNKSNMSNDDICDALIKKAMEGIKGIASNSLPFDEKPPVESKRFTRGKESLAVNKEIKTEPRSEDGDDVSLRQVKLSLEKEDKPTPAKGTRSNKSDAQAKKAETPQSKKSETPLSKRAETLQFKKSEATTSKKEAAQSSKFQKVINSESKDNSINNLSFDHEKPASPPSKGSDAEDKKEDANKPFDIMDYISMIKVNGVGILFQCKLCNRNFLKKEVVESHNCAKNGAPKVNIPKTVPAPEPPKVPSVKYIKIDGDMKKTLTEKVKMAQKIEDEKNSSLDNSVTQNDNNEPSPPKPKPRPKAGPASKTRRGFVDSNPSATPVESTPNKEPPTPPAAVAPSVQFPGMPNLNGRFKLVPGPNNIFTLVEDTSAAASTVVPTESPKKPGRKRKSDEVTDVEEKSKDRKISRDKSESPEVIDLEDQTQPYPVGLFQTMPHSARLFEAPGPEAPPTFTTPAMKKQSYTIVQTGDPSKLLISTKAKAIEEEPPKKRQKRSKPEVKEDNVTKEPFTVTLEDVDPPKDTGFFTFINVDPLLQPSYVLPTDNIIQESQISTSSAVLRNPAEKDGRDKEKYSCNMCGLTFSREKKLLTHIQSHYSKMDEEDQIKEKTEKTRKRGKK